MFINKDNYKDLLKGITVLEVSGEGCANCITLMPILYKLVQDYKNVNFHHLEVAEDTMDLVNMFQVERIPSVLILDNLDIKAKCSGFQPEEILDLWLKAKLNEILTF